MATKKTTTAKKATSSKRTATKNAATKKPAAKNATTNNATAKKSKDKMSGLDAAAKVLAESGEPLRAKDLVEQMAAKGYWKSPGGKTPSATIYAAMMREIRDKGKESRFQKTDRGLFTINK